MIHFHDRTGRIHIGIPAWNRSVFGGEQEERRLSRSYFECAGVIKDGTGGCATRRSVRPGNRNHKRLGRASAVIQRRHRGAVVGNPPWWARRTRHSPRIHEVRIDVRRGRSAGFVCGEISSLIVLRHPAADTQQDQNQSERGNSGCMFPITWARHNLLLNLWIL